MLVRMFFLITKELTERENVVPLSEPKVAIRGRITVDTHLVRYELHTAIHYTTRVFCTLSNIELQYAHQPLSALR